MGYEKLGKITQSNGKTYKRTVPGINLPTDYMTDAEIAELSGEVVTYFKEVKNEDN